MRDLLVSWSTFKYWQNAMRNCCTRLVSYSFSSSRHRLFSRHILVDDGHAVLVDDGDGAVIADQHELASLGDKERVDDAASASSINPGPSGVSGAAGHVFVDDGHLVLVDDGDP